MQRAVGAVHMRKLTVSAAVDIERVVSCKVEETVVDLGSSRYSVRARHIGVRQAWILPHPPEMSQSHARQKNALDACVRGCAIHSAEASHALNRMCMQLLSQVLCNALIKAS
jgi:hypothetical protein